MGGVEVDPSQPASTYYMKPWHNPAINSVYFVIGAFSIACMATQKLMDTFVVATAKPLFMGLEILLMPFKSSYLKAEKALAAELMKDGDDLPQIRFLLSHVFIIIPTFVSLCIMKWEANIATAALLWVYTLAQGPTALFSVAGLGHIAGHAYWAGGLFKKQYSFLNNWPQWGSLPMHGRFPENDRLCHVLCHHKYCNNLDDVECHLWYNRSSAFDFFFKYNPRLLVLRQWHVGYTMKFANERRWKHAFGVLKGQAFMFALGAALATLNPLAFLFVFVIPTFATNLIYNSGEWAMHGFSNPNSTVDSQNHIVKNCTILVDETPQREAFHAVHHAFNTSMSTPRKVDEQKRMHQVYETADIPFAFAKTEWKDCFTRLLGGKFEEMEACFVLPEGVNMKKEDKIALLKQSVEPIDLSKKTCGELTSTGLLGAACNRPFLKKSS
eukprot:gene5150-6263_t